MLEGSIQNWIMSKFRKTKYFRENRDVRNQKRLFFLKKGPIFNWALADIVHFLNSTGDMRSSMIEIELIFCWGEGNWICGALVY